MSLILGSSGSASSDDLLTDCDHLVHADPSLVVPLLAQAVGAEARLAAAVFRTSLHEHRDASPGVRRQLLSLDAARWGAPDLAERYAAVPVADEPEPQWTVASATGADVDPRLLFQFDGAWQGRAAAVTELDGRPIAVHGGVDGLRMWDMTSGEQIDRLAGSLAAVRHVVTIAEIDGRLLALTEVFGADGHHDDDEDHDDYDDGHSDEGARRLQVWDLTSGEPICEPFTGPANYLADAAFTIWGGSPVVVTFTRGEPVTVWDLGSGEPIAHPLFEPEDNNVAVACAIVDGRPVVVTAMVETLRVWSRAGDAWTCDMTIDHPGWLGSVAITELGGRPAIVTGSAADVPGGRFDYQVRMRDLATGDPIGRPLSSGHGGHIDHLNCTVLPGRTVVVTVAETDSTVRVWDLTAGRQIGRTLVGHRKPVVVAGIGEVNGRLLIVTGDNHDQARLWDLTLADPSGDIAPDRRAPVHAVACTELNGRSVVLLVGEDHAVRIWDVADGKPVKALATAGNVVAITELNGRPVAVTANWEDGHLVRDLLSGEVIGRPFAAQEYVAVQVAACAVVDGRCVILTAGGTGAAVRRWDLLSGEPIQPLTTSGEQTEPWGESMLAMACTELEGRPVAVAGGEGAEVWAWDLASGDPVGKPMTGHLKWTWEAIGKPGLGTKIYINAVTCAQLDGRPIAVTGGEDGTVRRWDLATGRQIGSPEITRPLSDDKVEAIDSVACTEVNGRAIVVSGARDHTVRVRDLVTGDQVGPELTFPYAVSQVAATSSGELVVRFGPEIAVLKSRT